MIRIPLPKSLRREYSDTKRSQEAAQKRLEEAKNRWGEVHEISGKVAKNRDRFAPLIEQALRGEQ